jgi:gluconolactonase
LHGERKALSIHGHPLTGHKLRVTEVGKGQVEELDVPCDGLPLHQPKFA